MYKLFATEESRQEFEKIMKSAVEKLAAELNSVEYTTINQIGSQQEPHSPEIDIFRAHVRDALGNEITLRLDELLSTQFGYPSILISYTGGTLEELSSLQSYTIDSVNTQISYAVRGNPLNFIHILSTWTLSDGNALAISATVVI